MKKVYIKPLIESMNSDLESQILKGSWNNHADSKEQDVFEDDETKPLEDLQFKNIWEDEEE